MVKHINTDIKIGNKTRFLIIPLLFNTALKMSFFFLSSPEASYVHLRKLVPGYRLLCLSEAQEPLALLPRA